MKQFANEKEGPAKKPSGGLDRDNQNSRQDKKNQEFGGFGTSGGNGYADPMEAAQFGHPGAMAMLQSGGGLGQKGPRPIPGHLVVKAQRLLGADLSGVTLEEDPFLAEQGKRGVAEDGQRIRLAPQAAGDMELIWHEIVHLLQQRGAKTSTSEIETVDAETRPVGSPSGPPPESGAPNNTVSGPQPVAATDAAETQTAGGVADPEAEAVAGAQALTSGEAFEVRAAAAGVMYQNEGEGPTEATAPTSEVDDSLEGSTKPLDYPQFLSSPEDWVTLQTALDRGPDDGLQALVRLTPILKENAKANITYSTAVLDGEAQTVFGPEAKAWLLQEFSAFQKQHQGLASEQLVVEYVKHVKQVGIPDSLQTVELFVNIDRLGTADEKELAYTISTIHHEMTHAHQLLHDYLRVFPAGVSLDPDWLGAEYPLANYVAENDADEISAMEIGAYSEQAKVLEVLGTEPRGDYSDALGTLNLIHQHWNNAPPEFRESADADGKFVQAYMAHLEHFLAGFLEAVRPVSIALLGGFDAASLAARHLGQGGIAGATGTPQAEDDEVKAAPEDRCALPVEAKPEGMWAPDSTETKQYLAQATNIEKLGYNQDKYEMLKQQPGWVDADGAFRTILEQRHEYPLAGQAVAELKVGLERAKTGGSTTLNALSDAVHVKNQQAADPNIFVPTPARFYGAGDATRDKVMPGFQQVPTAFARNALGCGQRWSVIEVTGYSDDLGKGAAREAISRQRAEVVKEMLVDTGVPGERIRVVAKGYAAPPGVTPERIEAVMASNTEGLERARMLYRQAVVVAVP